MKEREGGGREGWRERGPRPRVIALPFLTKTIVSRQRVFIKDYCHQKIHCPVSIALDIYGPRNLYTQFTHKLS